MLDPGLTSKLGSLAALLGLHRTARVFFALFSDRRMPLWLKVSAVSGLIYIFSPLDLMPEVTGIGLLDDIVVALLIMQTFLEFAPAHVLDEHCVRLGIRREDLFVSVPRTIKDALVLLEWAAARAGGAPAAQPAAPADAVAPSYLRYSAYQEDVGKA